MAIAGIDIGTTGCKCTIYNSEGVLINEAYKEYNFSNKQFIDANIVWENTKLVIKKALQKVDNIEAVGVTSFGESAVLIDKDDKALMPSLLYTSPHGIEQCRRLVK